MLPLTKEHRIARHKQFLSDNWRALAAFAWDGYRNQGRGAVVVPEDDFVHAERPEWAPVHAYYVNAEGQSLSEKIEWAEEKEDQWAETYEPNEKVIVIILRPEGGISSYLIGGETSPSACWEAEKAKDN